MGPWEHVDQTLNRFKNGVGSRRSLADTAYSSSESFHHRRSTDVFGRFAETVGSLNEAERRKQKRMLVMQEIFEGSPEYQCPKCTELQTKYATDRKRYFLEAEHLRRGVQKLLDTCQSLMSTSAFWVLKDSLQLGVRFFTEHTDSGVDSPRPAGDGGAIDSSHEKESRNPELENLLKENARLEEEIRRLERENAQLAKELATHQGKFLRASGSRGSASGRREDAAVQTEPMRFLKAKPRDPGLSDDDDGDDDSSKPVGTTVRHQLKRSRSQGARKRRSATGDDSDGSMGEAGGHSDDDHKANGSSTGAAKHRQQAKPSKTKPEVPDQSKEIERLKDELELLRKKLKAAELSAEQAQKTVETVKVVTVEKVVKEERVSRPVAGAEASEGIAPAAVDSTNAGRADAPARSAARSSVGGGDSGGGRASLAVPDDPGKAARRRSRSGQLARASTTRIGPTGQSRGSSAGASEEAEGIPQGTAARVAAAVAAAEAKWKEQAQVKKDLVDACVGNGPGPGMQDEPVRCQGKQIKKLEELNKTGAVFQRTLRLGPDLGPSPFVGTAHTSAAAPEGTAVASSSTANAEPKPNQGPGALAEPRPGKAPSLGERKPSKPHGDAETHKGAAQPKAATAVRPTRAVSPERETLPDRPQGGRSSPQQEQPRAPAMASAQSTTRAQATAPAQASARARSAAVAASTAPTQPNLEVEVRAELRAEARAEARAGRTPASPSKALSSTWVGATSSPNKGLASTVPTISENAPQPPPSAGALDSDVGGAGAFNDAEPRGAKLASTLGAAPSGGSPRNFFRESRPMRQMARSLSATTRGSTVGEEPMLGTDTLREAEPYLLQVWDQRGQGNKKAHQSELMKLGALTPEPPKLPRTVSSNTLAAMLRE